MSRGPILTAAEITRAAELRRKRLTWEVVSLRLGRDRVGLHRAIARAQKAPPKQTNSRAAAE